MKALGAVEGTVPDPSPLVDTPSSVSGRELVDMSVLRAIVEEAEAGDGIGEGASRGATAEEAEAGKTKERIVDAVRVPLCLCPSFHADE